MMQVLAFYSIIKYGILRVINTPTVNCQLVNSLNSILISFPSTININSNVYRPPNPIRRSLSTIERRSLSNFLTKEKRFLLYCNTFR
jgi:hypothetical protein